MTNIDDSYREFNIFIVQLAAKHDQDNEPNLLQVFLETGSISDYSLTRLLGSLTMFGHFFSHLEASYACIISSKHNWLFHTVYNILYHNGPTILKDIIGHLEKLHNLPNKKNGERYKSSLSIRVRDILKNPEFISKNTKWYVNISSPNSKQTVFNQLKPLFDIFSRLVDLTFNPDAAGNIEFAKGCIDFWRIFYLR